MKLAMNVSTTANATTRLLKATPDTVHWGFFDAKLKPLLSVASGVTVTISTVSGMASQMPAPPLTLTLGLEGLADLRRHCRRCVRS